MASSSTEQRTRKIGVLWDVKECPVPDGVERFDIYEAFKSALEDKGYKDEFMAMFAYDEENTIPDADVWSPLVCMNSKSKNVSGGKPAIVEKMVADIMMYWAKPTGASTLILISAESILESKGLVSVLKSLQLRGFEIIFAQSVLPTSASVWLSGVTLPPQGVVVSPIFWSTPSVEKTATPNCGTILFWDVEDYPIPKDLDPAASVYGKIDSALRDRNYSGQLYIKAYEGKTSMLESYNGEGIIVSTKLGDKYERVLSMFIDILFCSFDNPAPANYMVLSKGLPGISKNQSRDTFLDALSSLGSLGRNNVVYSERSLWIYESLSHG